MNKGARAPQELLCLQVHPLFMLSQHFSCIIVPATPESNVCVVYDEGNGALQIIESTWNEVVYTHIASPL